MASHLEFSGFSKQTIKFYRDLKENNSKAWFEENRNIFNDYVMAEAQLFVVEIGNRLEKIAPEIVAIPKTDKSIFRIYRDVRFSKDKKPFKTHLALLFWEGPFKKLENSSFYFHLEPSRLFLGSGIYVFPKHIIQEYRDSVVHSKYGKELVQIIETVQKNSSYKLGWKQYKKTPRGYDPEHKNADLLLHGGLGFQFEETIPKQIYTSEAVDYVFEKFKEMAPIHNWLRKMTERVAKNS
ncbi:DUF2461 domain-containing protein, partial [Calditrichota bacterium]